MDLGIASIPSGHAAAILKGEGDKVIEYVLLPAV